MHPVRHHAAPVVITCSVAGLGVSCCSGLLDKQSEIPESTVADVSGGLDDDEDDDNDDDDVTLSTPPLLHCSCASLSNAEFVSAGDDDDDDVVVVVAVTSSSPPQMSGELCKNKSNQSTLVSSASAMTPNASIFMLSSARLLLSNNRSFFRLFVRSFVTSCRLYEIDPLAKLN